MRKIAGSSLHPTLIFLNIIINVLFVPIIRFIRFSRTFAVPRRLFDQYRILNELRHASLPYVCFKHCSDHKDEVTCFKFLETSKVSRHVNWELLSKGEKFVFFVFIHKHKQPMNLWKFKPICCGRYCGKCAEVEESVHAYPILCSIKISFFYQSLYNVQKQIS